MKMKALGELVYKVVIGLVITMMVLAVIAVKWFNPFWLFLLQLVGVILVFVITASLFVVVIHTIVTDFFHTKKKKK